jgi:hypothetical protein
MMSRLLIYLVPADPSVARMLFSRHRQTAERRRCTPIAHIEETAHATLPIRASLLLDVRDKRVARAPTAAGVLS